MSEASKASKGPKGVGYRSPPTSTQFKKGRSGNPRGRPKKGQAEISPVGVTLLEDIVLNEAYRPVTINENGRPETMPLFRAMMRSISVAAVKGDHRSQLHILKLVNQIEGNRQQTKQQFFETMVEYKTRWTEVFQSCDRNGQPRPDPVPHPDDIVISADNFEVIINGPFTEEEQKTWRFMQNRAQVQLKEIDRLQNEIKRFPRRRKALEPQIKEYKAYCEFLIGLCPTEEIRRVTGFRLEEWRDADPRFRQLQVERGFWMSVN